MPDFFNNQCREPAIEHKKFGICDDEDGTKAYTDCENPDKWIAVIMNTNEISLTFTPIDNCLMMKNEYPGVKRCDGMITAEKQLYLFELKNKKGSTYGESLKQLESTIRHLYENNTREMENYNYKRACICKRKKKKKYHSNDSYNADNSRLRRAYGFRLEVDNEIFISKRSVS